MKLILTGLNTEFNNTVFSMDSSLSNDQKTNIHAIKSMLDELKVNMFARLFYLSTDSPPVKLYKTSLLLEQLAKMTNN